MDSFAYIRSPCFILTYHFYGLLLDVNGTLDILVYGRTAWISMVLWIWQRRSEIISFIIYNRGDQYWVLWYKLSYQTIYIFETKLVKRFFALAFGHFSEPVHFDEFDFWYSSNFHLNGMIFKLQHLIWTILLFCTILSCLALCENFLFLQKSSVSSFAGFTETTNFWFLSNFHLKRMIFE